MRRISLFALEAGLFLMPALCLGLDPSKDLAQFNYRNWTVENGLPANEVNTITQTRDGYIWLGTQTGLVRYDGTVFELIQMPQVAEFRSQSVMTLSTARDGGLWFGVSAGAFGKYLDGNFLTFTNQPWVKSWMNVCKLTEVEDGLWVSSAEGTALMRDHGAGVWFGQPVWARSTCRDRQGRVWLGTVNQGLWCWQNNTLTNLPIALLRSTSIQAMALDTDGSLFLGTGVGLMRLDAKGVLTQLATKENVRALLVDRAGTLWIGSERSGLLRYRGGEVSQFARADGLVNDSVLSIHEDTEGSLWVGTRDGLTQITDVKFPIYSASQGLPGGIYRGVFPSREGGIWAGCDEGITHFDGNVAVNFQRDAGLSNPQTKRVFEASDGDKYIINGQQDIEILGSSNVVVTFTNSVWPTALAEDHHGVVASVGSDLVRVSRTGIAPYLLKTNTPFYWIRNLSSCRDGSILVGCVVGVLQLKDGEIVRQWGGGALPNPDVLCAIQDDEGVIWAGTPDGLAIIVNNKVVSVRHNNGLFCDYIIAIVADLRGDMWFNSNKGIFRVNRKALLEFASGTRQDIECTVFTGLNSVKCRDVTEVEYQGARSLDGRIWFPSPKGLIMIDPARVSTNSHVPTVFVQRVLVDKAELTNKTHRVSAPGRGDLQFDYTGLSYVAPSRMAFRYQLVGYDASWVDVGTRRSAYYTGIEPGNYEFRVQAANEDGVWNTVGASYSIYLPPHFYQTVWFKTLCGLAILSAVAGAYAWRIRRLHLRQKELQNANELLEAKVRERTAELADQRNLLRSLIDNLPDRVFAKDTAGRVIVDNLAHAVGLGYTDPTDAVGKTDFESFPRELADKYRTTEVKVMQTGSTYNAEESHRDIRTGKVGWWMTTKVPLRDGVGQIIGITGINRDLTERKQTEARLETLHQQLLDASRQAGMAEIATGVLHNVGNVLNSVNVSTSLITDRIRLLPISNLGKLVDMIGKHASDLADYLTQDSKGRLVPSYLETLNGLLAKEQSLLLEELQNLSRNIDHIKVIVSAHQEYARTGGVLMPVKPVEMFEDALQMQVEAYQRHNIEVVRDFDDVPTVLTDRHKVIQILGNLLTNAKYACDYLKDGRKVVLQLKCVAGDRFSMRVADNGVGVPSENLTRIFNHGFTTRRNGHGFGLHSGALAAKEMGGTLTVHSEGMGQGASFTLELPMTPPELENGPETKAADNRVAASGTTAAPGGLAGFENR